MRLNIRIKLIGVTALILLIPSVLIGLSGYFTAKSQLDDVGKTGLKNNVVMAMQMIDALNVEVKRGNLTLKEAQDEVKERLIGSLQLDGTRKIDLNVNMGKYGYFFILDQKGVAVAHPTLEGKNLYDSQAPDGKYTTRETIKMAESGGGFVQFDFAVPGEERLAPKVVYSEQDSNWGWVVVAGSYLEDFNSGAT